jgi:hypothetical protein
MRERAPGSREARYERDETPFAIEQREALQFCWQWTAPMAAVSARTAIYLRSPSWVSRSPNPHAPP